MRTLEEIIAAWEPEEGGMTTVDDASLRYLIRIAQAADRLLQARLAEKATEEGLAWTDLRSALEA